MEMGFVGMFEHGIALECKQINLDFVEDRQILGEEIGFWVLGIWPGFWNFWIGEFLG